MYQLKLATTEESIIKFEENRMEAFGNKTKYQSVEQTPYGKGIQEGDFLAFHCLKENQIVGGMLIGTQKNDIVLERLFVKKEERQKGAGSYMMNYLEQNQEFLGDYFGIDCYGILLEPVRSSIDFYYNRGFDYSGYQMYKQYDKRYL